MLTPRWFIAAFLLLAACASALSPRPLEKFAPRYHSPCALAWDAASGCVYVAEETAGRVSRYDPSAGTVTTVADLGRPVTGIATGGDGRVFVTAGGADGAVYIVDAGTGTVERTIPVGHTPMSPIVSPDCRVLYVCNRFSDTVSVIDLDPGTVRENIPMLREPVAAALTPDGERLYVINHLPSARKIQKYVIDGGYMSIRGFRYDQQYDLNAVVLVADTATGELAAMVTLPKGSTGLRGICVSPDGAHVYVTHILARYLNSTASVENGNINANALSIINAKSFKLEGTVLLDDARLGAANPWGVACSRDGASLIVAHAGTHELGIIDRAELHRRLPDIAVPDTLTRSGDISPYLGRLEGIRTRVVLPGNGPRAVVAADGACYAGMYFSDSIARVTLPGNGGRSAVTNISLTNDITAEAADIERRGEQLFNDATLCREWWQSCASCHPDARADGLNWDLLNDGAGNPKNTKSLLYSHRTPPAMISGIRASAEVAVRAGLKYILFAERPEADAEAIDAYLRSLEPVPSPWLEQGGLSREARRGRRIFERAGCAGCHPSPLFTDLQKYDVGTGTGETLHQVFDTPTLVEIWRTDPYLYDGRAKNLYELMTIRNNNDRHGVTSPLDPAEQYYLMMYLLSL